MSIIDRFSWEITCIDLTTAIDKEQKIDIHLSAEPCLSDCMYTPYDLMYMEKELLNRVNGHSINTLYGKPSIKNVIFNDPATIVFWGDGTKTVVKCSEDDVYDAEKGLSMAIAKKFDYYNQMKPHLKKYEAKLAEDKKFISGWNKFVEQITNMGFNVRFVDSEDKEEPKMKYVDYVYDILKAECKGLDSIYRDYIESIVGEKGLQALIEAKLVETCGVVNNRQLYTLCDKK